jgi:N-formylglutamate amidohydrolase
MLGKCHAVHLFAVAIVAVPHRLRYITKMPDCMSPRPFEIRAPDPWSLPVVVASPHSGSDYPDSFVRESRLDPLALRKSEDCFVDILFSEAPALGAPLLRALFPRAFVDPNREPYELDPAMFEEELPSFVNRRSSRVASGLGTIPRVVADGQAIYPAKLRFADVEARIEKFYHPYHDALEGLVTEAVARFGHCILIDAHSMPSGSAIANGSSRQADIVLGDRIGRSCHPVIRRTAERVLCKRGYKVALNAPYAGGHTTVLHGKPAIGRHCLQIEINRRLYMDEMKFEPLDFIETLKLDLAEVIKALAALPATMLSH